MIHRLLEAVGLGTRTAGAILVARYTLWRRDFPVALSRYGLTAVEDGPAVASGSLEGVDPASLRTALRVLRAPVIGSTCLPTSLALASVLAGHGIPSDVVIGVSGDSLEFEAHAWVEAGGRRLDVSGFPPDRFSEIGRFRSSGASAG